MVTHRPADPQSPQLFYFFEVDIFSHRIIGRGAGILLFGLRFFGRAGIRLLLLERAARIMGSVLHIPELLAHLFGGAEDGNEEIENEPV